MNNHPAKDISGLDVYFQEQKIGRLRLDEKRRFVFQYDAVWINRQDAVPLSLNLPLRAEPYPDDLSKVFPFLGMVSEPQDISPQTAVFVSVHQTSENQCDCSEGGHSF